MNTPVPVKVTSYIAFFGYAIVFLFTVGFSYQLIGSLYEDYNMYQSESKCIREYVQASVPRSFIEAEDGTCTILFPPRWGYKYNKGDKPLTHQ